MSFSSPMLMDYRKAPAKKTSAPREEGPVSIEMPEQRSYAQEYADILNTQLAMAPQLYAAEAQYRPQVAGIDYGIYNTYLPKYLQTLEGQVPRIAGIAQDLTTRQRQADIADVLKLGPEALAAYKASNPEQARLLDSLTSQALADLGAGSSLSPNERRDVIQNSRAGAADRGMALSTPSAFAEVMDLDRYGRARQNERRGFAGNVAQLTSQIYGDPFQAVVGRPAANLAFANQVNQIPTQPTQSAQLFGTDQYASNLFGQNQQSELTGATTNAGLANDYWNTLYNADAAKSIASSNRTSGLLGGALGGLGSIFGGWLAGRS
jgi:hypothetical protein